MSTPNHIEDREIEQAAENLGHFWSWQSRYHADWCGFGFVLQADAPNAPDELKAAWQRSKCTFAPLPISSRFIDTSVYGDPLVNGAYRHVHDVMHAITGLSFGTYDELELADIHLQAVRGAGFNKSSVEHAIAHADMIGQILGLVRNGAYPVDQKLFVHDCVRHGIDAAVELEAIRSLPAAP